MIIWSCTASRVQAVTIEQIQEVAQKYVKPDVAALVMVGDGAQLTDQIKPYAEEIEFYSTSGKKKSHPSTAPGETRPAVEATLAGDWSLQIESPLGQSIPATLILANSVKGLSGRVNRKWETANYCRRLLMANRSWQLFRLRLLDIKWKPKLRAK